MTIKVTRTTVSFNGPFSLRNVEGIQPAGSYAVCVEEELIEGLSHAAYRRVSTSILIQMPSMSSSDAQSRFVQVDQTDLEATLMKDLHQTV
jgi:hypothetical protein